MAHPLFRPVRYSLIVLQLFIGLLVLRAPSFLAELIDPDEAHFLVMGRMLTQGAIPYVDVVDKKPILTYLFYSPAGYFGFSMVPMKVIGLLWALGTCLILYRAAELWTGRKDTGFVAAWLYVAVSSCNNLAIHAELMMNLPAALALLYFIRAHREGRRLDDFWCGLSIGIATLFRHQAGIVLVALLSAVLWACYSQRKALAWSLGRCAALAIGVFIPWLVVVGLYARMGHLAEFYDWNIARNFFYVMGTSSSGSLVRLGRGILLYVVLAAPLPWLFSLIEGTRLWDPVRVGLLLSLLLTWIPVSMSGRYYSQYFVQFAVPLALLAAPSLEHNLARWSQLSRARKGVLLGGLIAPLIFYLGYGVGRRLWEVLPYPSRDPRAVAIGRWVRENSQPGDTLFVWGYIPPVYQMSQRLPGTRYVTTAVHLGDIEPSHIGSDFNPALSLSARDISATLSDLEQNQPLLVIDTAPTDLTHFSPFPLRVVPTLFDYILAHYDLLSVTPAGAHVYRLKTRPAS